MNVGRTTSSFRRALLGFVCGIAAGPLFVFAVLVAQSGNLMREYELVLLSDGTAESKEIAIRIDEVAPARRQHIDLPSAPLRRLSLFEPHDRRIRGAVLDIVRRDGGDTTVLKQMPLEYPRGDKRCVVVVTVEAGIADAGPCRSLLRYL
ncbi:MAG: hypothetical protein JNL71_08155 [Rhodospirillales bacterium]|nr:hypothetical protein [Rhodospirillales bacterium]